MNGRPEPACGWLSLSLAFGLVVCWGCGGSSESSSTPSSASADTESAGGTVDSEHRSTPPVAAISADNGLGEEGAVPRADAGTPDQLLREIVRIRTQINVRANPQTESSTAETASKTRAQHEKIIEKARQIIATTHQDEAKKHVFNNAVHYLSDARLELAMLGDTEQAQLLIDDADSLYQRDPKSFASVESAYKLVELAQRKAEQQGKQNLEWGTEFANQARLFVEKFPHEANRCALTLLTAGQFCDRHGLADDARRCFTIIRDEFPDTIFAEQVYGVLRRLSLVGQPLELAGPTLDGGYTSIDQYRGQLVLVVFWASTSSTFGQDLERLEELDRKSDGRDVKLIGVNLDQDEGAIDEFLAEHPLTWPQVFYSEPDKRGGRNPTARYYGVQKVPTYWLIDRSGIVVATPDDLHSLVVELQALAGKS